MMASSNGNIRVYCVCLGMPGAGMCECVRKFPIRSETRSTIKCLHARFKSVFLPPMFWLHVRHVETAPTLSRWSSSGNPVAIQCAWQLDPSVHWNATGERNLVASVLPVVFWWSSSGFPMVFQCVPIMQINTGSPLGHHWVLASSSVVPVVAFQCTCGSSGLSVCSNYAN